MSEIKLIINGKECVGQKGQTILEIANANGIFIPTLCHLAKVKNYGACGVCVVEGEGLPKLMRACSTVAADGWKINTESKRAVQARKVALERLDEIVEYSDLGKFIDNPVRTYSSGMKARLAFSVMIFVDADIFLVDEALSTGDAAFATKASEHLKNLVRNGKTVLMTSHNIRTIRSSCNRAIWLSDKTIFMDGPVDEVCDAYSKSIME